MTDSDGKSGSPETKNQRKITRILVRTGAPVRTATRNVEVSNFNFAVFLPAKFDVQNGVVDTTNGDGTNRKITGNFYTAQILARDVTKKNFSRFSGIKITALSTEPARTGTNRHEPDAVCAVESRYFCAQFGCTSTVFLSIFSFWRRREIPNTRGIYYQRFDSEFGRQ
jgi:hypothetical protein